MAEAPNLRLLALDEEDLNVVSAHLQDAVVKVRDMSLVAGTGQFALAVNRFAREAGATRKGFKKTFERRRSALHFGRVKAVRSIGIDRSNPDQVLVLLAVHFEPDLEPENAPAGEVSLVFAGDAMLTLEVECIEARLTDLGPAWATERAPRHPAGD